MLRRSDLDFRSSDLLGLDDELPAMQAPDWIKHNLEIDRAEADERDGLGLRSLLARPEAQARAWRLAETSVRPGGVTARRRRHPRVRAL